MEKTSSPQATSSLTAWLSYLENLHASTIDLGLDRVRQVAQRLEILCPTATVFTVAGTNGKGTTCRVLEMVLLAAGYRVGVYSSPHLLDYNERVRIQGQELADSEHCRSFAVVEQQRSETSLTYFEFSTLSALWLFKQAQLDVIILEVGLGGRLDATNIIDADVAVITSIDLDHTDWLGDSRESIGREKAGIIRSGKPIVVGEPDMPGSIGLVAAQHAARLYRLADAWNYTDQQETWCWENGVVCWSELPVPQVPLQNAATALAALYYSALKIDRAALLQGLQQAKLPGRFQVVSQSPRLILDVAHNPHAAKYLGECLSKLPKSDGYIRAVVGMLVDKDIAGTLACLESVVQVWYCAGLPVPRGATSEQLAQYLPTSTQFTHVELAWQQAMNDAAPQDTVIVFGSFHTVAPVMQALKQEKRGG